MQIGIYNFSDNIRFEITSDTQNTSNHNKSFALHEKCPYLELFWLVFSHIQTEYGEVRSIFLYSVRMRGNRNQINSKYRQFLRSVVVNKTIGFTLLSF